MEDKEEFESSPTKPISRRRRNPNKLLERCEENTPNTPVTLRFNIDGNSDSETPFSSECQSPRNEKTMNVSSVTSIQNVAENKDQVSPNDKNQCNAIEIFFKEVLDSNRVTSKQENEILESWCSCKDLERKSIAVAILSIEKSDGFWLNSVFSNP